jgi:hypothetical protein
VRHLSNNARALSFEEYGFFISCYTFGLWTLFKNTVGCRLKNHYFDLVLQGKASRIESTPTAVKSWL